LNIGVSRNRFCYFLADPDSRSFSRFGAIIMQFAVTTSFPVIESAKLFLPRQAQDKFKANDSKSRFENPFDIVL